MGKGTIVNHIADGKYNVTLKIDDTRAQATIINLDTAISGLNTTITDLVASKNAAWAMYDSARAKLNSIIAQYMAGTATREQVVAATTAMNAKYRLYIEYDRQYRSSQLRQEALRKRKAYIEDKLAKNSEPTIEAWCADLTEDLSGIVGTIEIPNERTNDVQVRPGYDGEAVYTAARDGQLQHIVSSTPAGVYYNYAMFPGWQKWMPTYRVGEITAKPTQDTAHVLLDSANSSAQGLDVNVSNTLSDVPIVYMDCDGSVFVVGDRVVVEFINQNYTNPRIIGFETNPKACNLKFYLRYYRLPPVADVPIHPVLIDTFEVYDSAKTKVVGASYSYDAATELYTVIFPPAHVEDPSGYWIFWKLKIGSVPTAVQHPFRYKSADMWDNADLVRRGTHISLVPRWTIYDQDDPLLGGPSNEVSCPTGYAVSRKRTVLSSIPYRITRVVPVTIYTPTEVITYLGETLKILAQYDYAPIYVDGENNCCANAPCAARGATSTYEYGVRSNSGPQGFLWMSGGIINQQVTYQAASWPSGEYYEIIGSPNDVTGLPHTFTLTDQASGSATLTCSVHSCCDVGGVISGSHRYTFFNKLNYNMDVEYDY